MTATKKRRIHDLLKGIETGDPASVEVVNESKYIQHNPHNREGSEGLAELFARLALTSPRVDIVRVFQDGDYLDGQVFIEHNPEMSDDLSGLRSALSRGTDDGNRRVDYQRSHRVLAEGNFVLTVSEGFRSGVHSSFHDLFRVANGKIVEHWDTVSEVPPRSEWKNDNGKF
jgi:predicted SnoaL-like aldol condensation-catalyzing enzyme